MNLPAPAAATTAATPRLGIGQVRHQRLRPAPNGFTYPTWFVLLPLRSLRAQASPALPRNRAALVSFFDRDHGDGRDDCVAWMDELLQAHGVHDADGELWLHTFPRVLGYVFKPVSFWYAHRANGSLAAIVAEVNNTFGERHCYLLDGPGLAFGRELHARKVFHVSPFCRVAGDYRFRFMRTDLGNTAHASAGPAGLGRSVVRIEHHDEQGALLLTSVSGHLQPLTAGALRQTFWRMPLVTLGVVARIHWQALRLWRLRVPFVRKPDRPPAELVTR
jgi:DUF1365 family protein